MEAQRILIHDLLDVYVSHEAATRFLADTTVPSIEEIRALSKTAASGST